MTWNFVVEIKKRYEKRKIQCTIYLQLLVFKADFFFLSALFKGLFRRKRIQYKYLHIVFSALGKWKKINIVFLPILIRNCPLGKKMLNKYFRYFFKVIRWKEEKYYRKECSLLLVVWKVRHHRKTRKVGKFLSLSDSDLGKEMWKQHLGAWRISKLTKWNSKAQQWHSKDAHFIFVFNYSHDYFSLLLSDILKFKVLSVIDGVR